MQRGTQTTVPLIIYIIRTSNYTDGVASQRSEKRRLKKKTIEPVVNVSDFE